MSPLLIPDQVDYLPPSSSCKLPNFLDGVGSKRRAVAKREIPRTSRWIARGEVVLAKQIYSQLFADGRPAHTKGSPRNFHFAVPNLLLLFDPGLHKHAGIPRLFAVETRPADRGIDVVVEELALRRHLQFAVTIRVLKIISQTNFEDVFSHKCGVWREGEGRRWGEPGCGYRDANLR